MSRDDAADLKVLILDTYTGLDTVATRDRLLLAIDRVTAPSAADQRLDEPGRRVRFAGESWTVAGHLPSGHIILTQPGRRVAARLADLVPDDERGADDPSPLGLHDAVYDIVGDALARIAPLLTATRYRDECEAITRRVLAAVGEQLGRAHGVSP